ncbi:MAG TPA: glycosyltransferase family 2 protein [Candidatus Binatia bacterium]|jgi:glycosyltransferase involved in cell wall biosynthesis
MVPRVSVIIPAYNNGKLLGETLEGIARQTLKDFEIIVVDDGSTDETGAVVKTFDPAIIYIYQSNKGPAAARNKGVSLARAELIAFCDHDDIWLPYHLQGLTEALLARPGPVLVFDNAEYFKTGQPTRRAHLDAKSAHLLSRSPVSARDLLWENPIASMSNVVVVKAIFEKFGGLSEKVGVIDDFHFYLRMAAAGMVRFVDYVGVRKRIGDNNLSGLVNLKENNILYLEDIWRNYPEVVRHTGRLSFRFRLARKYFKLGRSYLAAGDKDAARRMFRRAYGVNFMNPRYFWYTLAG